MNEGEKMFAGQCGRTLLNYLEHLKPDKIAKMRIWLGKRRMKQEESRDWGLVGKESKSPIHGIVRTRTGYFYR